MYILSDSQAELVTGGRQQKIRGAAAFPQGGNPLTETARAASAQLSHVQKITPFTAINIVVAPMINLAVIVAMNGGKATINNQSNALTAVLQA